MGVLFIHIVEILFIGEGEVYALFINCGRLAHQLTLHAFRHIINGLAVCFALNEDVSLCASCGPCVCVVKHDFAAAKPLEKAGYCNGDRLAAYADSSEEKRTHANEEGHCNTEWHIGKIAKGFQCNEKCESSEGKSLNKEAHLKKSPKCSTLALIINGDIVNCSTFTHNFYNGGMRCFLLRRIPPHSSFPQFQLVHLRLMHRPRLRLT